MSVQTQQPKTFIASSEDILLYVMTALVILVMGCLGWLAGGFFTLLAFGEVLKHWDLVIPEAGFARWLIPLGFSVVEVAIFRFRERLPTWLLAVGGIITVLDFLSTVFGIVVAISGIELRLLTGYRVPDVTSVDGGINPIPVLIGAGVSAIITFGPEQLIMSALRMLKLVVVGFWMTWRTR